MGRLNAREYLIRKKALASSRHLRERVATTERFLPTLPEIVIPSQPSYVIVPYSVTMIQADGLTADLTITDPGTSYVTHGFDMWVDFSTFDVVARRMNVAAFGSEAGSGKGVRVVRVTDSAVFDEYTWTGVSIQQVVTGWGIPASSNDWTFDDELRVQVKGSSATEDMVVWRVELQMLGRVKLL